MVERVMVGVVKEKHFLVLWGGCSNFCYVWF